MKLNDKTSDGLVQFGNLGINDVFKYNDSIYMKSNTVVKLEMYINCINLESGVLSFVKNAEFVVPVDVEMNITDKK